MSKPKEEKRVTGGVEKKKSKKSKKDKTPKADKTKSEAAFSLLADETSTNPVLSSLFAVKPTPPQPKPILPASKQPAAQDSDDGVDEDAQGDEHEEQDASSDLLTGANENEASLGEPDPSKRRRKRKHDEEQIEDVYMRRLAREEAKEADAAASERALKRQKGSRESENAQRADNDEQAEEESIAATSDDDITDAEGDDELYAASPPPKHETLEAADVELSKANRTVFLGNVSTAAITSKSARKTLIKHLQSFFPTPSTEKVDSQDTKAAVESIRFRSTPYASSIPKKAAFATKQLMDATTKSTNAYTVYSSEKLAREAVKSLNGSIVLDRHLRVDSVAHPAKIDHRRCVFVGGLNFVDDESNIQAANEAEGKETRKPSKGPPGDVEEGLWRTFGKCGTVESVRVIRDGKTRVGKGVAYVQFADEVAVETALGNDGKKFPPLLPRKIRVERAKAQKRNAKPGSGRPGAKTSGGGTGYQRKISAEEKSRLGRTGKLFGRAAAAQFRKTPRNEDNPNMQPLGEGIKKPESFIFEGYRATSKSGKAGLKLGGRKKKGGKVTGRSSAFRAKAKGK